jgi:hypothetical protein
MLRLSALILLVVMLVNTAWYYPVTHYQRGQIRREMKRRLKSAVPDSQLHLITVRSAKDPSIKWTRENKEFRYRGMMYDIVRYEINDSSIIYHCINDMEETILFAQLEQKVQQRMDHQEDGGQAMLVKKMVKSMSTTVCLLPSYQSILAPVYALHHQTGYIDHLTAPAREILTPPPQV